MLVKWATGNSSELQVSEYSLLMNLPKHCETVMISCQQSWRGFRNGLVWILYLLKVFLYDLAFTNFEIFAWDPFHQCILSQFFDCKEVLLCWKEKIKKEGILLCAFAKYLELNRNDKIYIRFDWTSAKKQWIGSMFNVLNNYVINRFPKVLLKVCCYIQCSS